MKKSSLFIVWISFFSSLSLADMFEDDSNPNLQLCKDFKNYLERHAGEPLYCNLVPDEEFKDFRLPKLKSAPKGLGLRINVQARMINSDNYQEQLNQAINVSLGNRYRVTRLDFNNDGNVESVLVQDKPEQCLKTGFAAYGSYVYDNKHLNIDSSFISSSKYYSSQSGQLFFYKGRVYSAFGSKSGYEIYEPVGFREDKLIPRNAICLYDRKNH